MKGKVAIITGGASGIGRATAVLMAKEGAKVAIVDLNVKGGEETVEIMKSSGGEGTFIQSDVTKESEVIKMVRQVVSAYGHIDILYNNAGGWQREAGHDTITENSSEEWSRLINLNLGSTFLCSKYVVPEMKKAGGGSIINTSSTAGVLNWPSLAAYGTSKAAIIQLTKSMCLDYGPANIRVNVVAPGEVVTPQWTATYDLLPNKKEVLEGTLRKIPLGRFAQPDDVAKVVVWLASDESAYVSGVLLMVDGGTTAGFFG